MISLLVFTYKPAATSTDIFRETRAISKATDKLTKKKYLFVVNMAEQL